MYSASTAETICPLAVGRKRAPPRPVAVAPPPLPACLEDSVEYKRPSPSRSARSFTTASSELHHNRYRVIRRRHRHLHRHLHRHCHSPVCRGREPGQR